MPEVDAAGVAVRAERRKAFLGLIEPPVSVSRLNERIGVMASPPTITIGGYNVANTITGKIFEETDAAFRYFGSAVPVQEHPNWYKAGPNTNYWAVDFEIDCQEFEVLSQASGGAGKFRLIVDGEYHSADVQVGQTGAGSWYIFKVAFASKAIRHVVIEGDLNFKFGGVYLATEDHLWQSSTPVGPRIAWLGDSYVEGAMEGTTYGPYGLAVEASKLLGWRDIQCEGEGGTGYLKTSGAKPKYRDRVATQIVPAAPDVVLVWSSINDLTFTPAEVQAEAELDFDEIRASLPDAILIVVSLISSGTPQQSSLDVRDALQTAATGRVHLFIDPISATTPGVTTAGWITGAGNVGAPTGVGNSDAYTSSDGVHPTRAGHAYLGSRVAQAIAKWTRAGSPFGAIHAGNTLTIP